jgi:hypothetical protein
MSLSSASLQCTFLKEARFIQDESSRSAPTIASHASQMAGEALLNSERQQYVSRHPGASAKTRIPRAREHHPARYCRPGRNH